MGYTERSEVFNTYGDLVSLSENLVSLSENLVSLNED